MMLFFFSRMCKFSMNFTCHTQVNIETKSSNRLLCEMVDEVYMFDCALLGPEYLALLHNCQIHWNKQKSFNFKTNLTNPCF